MSSRVLRRTFAPAFVVTVACAAPALSDPKPPPSPPGKNPPAPREPAKYARSWHVSRSADGKTCSAMPHVECPKPEPGKAVPTCNPPAPIAYACPAHVKEPHFVVELAVGATECRVKDAPCPDNAKCAQPTRVVACPQ